MSESAYKTKQRATILKCLKENEKRAYCVDEIVDLLKARGEAVGRTTVYRYVDALSKSGKLRRFAEDGKRSVTYQYIENCEECSEHMHLKCLACGKLIHLDCDFMNGVSEHIMAHHGFCVDNSRTTILGLCADCINKQTKEKEKTHAAD
ncbi:MAG: Fur family transcriptional regulator [Acutalibacteraceae bacterium]